jgi:hypothetical protein
MQENISVQKNSHSDHTDPLMKSLLLFICLTGFLIAEEALPEEVKIDPLISVKEQFSKARKKGWDFSENKKKTQFQAKSDGINFEFKPPDLANDPYQRAKSFRNDISDVERMKAIDRQNEIERNFKPPKNKSR